MADDQHIDPGDLASDARDRVLAGDPGGDGVVGRLPVEPRVGHHDHHVGAGAAHPRDLRGDRRLDVPNGHATAEVIPIPDQGAGIGDADDGDLDPCAGDDRRARERAPAVEPVGVRGEEGEACLRPGPIEGRDAVVELVVPDRGRVVAHRVHRRDHRARGEGIDPGRHIGHRVPLEEVPGVDQDHAVGGGPAQGVDDGGGAGEATGRVRRVGVVVPAAEAAVDVGRRGDGELDGALGPERGRDEQGGGERRQPYASHNER